MAVILSFGDSLTFGFDPETGGRFPPEYRFMGVFFVGREAESRELAAHFRTICEQTGTSFFAAGGVMAPSPTDGIHLDPQGQRTLGQALADQVRALLP